MATRRADLPKGQHGGHRPATKAMEHHAFGAPPVIAAGRRPLCTVCGMSYINPIHGLPEENWRA